MRTLYFDCFSGASGDMLLGALVDLGLDATALERELGSLGLEPFRLVKSRVDRSGLSAVKIDVVIGDCVEGPGGLIETYTHGVHRGAHGKPDPHGHTHGHGHPHGQGAPHEHAHGHAHHEHAHGHAHDGQDHRQHSTSHEHGHGHHHHEHSRGLSEILALIEGSTLPALTKTRAARAFRRLGEAEAKMHGTTPEQVHFHEVGAADAIVDIVGTMLGFELLGIERFVCSPINVGGGTVTFSHGTYPVPAPATAELLRGAPIYSGAIQKELATPTAAAILSTVVDEFGRLPELHVERVGYGAGSRDFPGHPNALRLLLGRSEATVALRQSSTRVAVLEAAIDDMTAEALGYFAERALEAGALDVYTVPAAMKKSRPGVELTVLCESGDVERMVRLLFAETTTLGVRHRLSDRYVLDREHVTVETAAGPVRMKIGRLGGEVVTASPEFDDCREAALRTGAPLKEVQAMAIAAYRASVEKR